MIPDVPENWAIILKRHEWIVDKLMRGYVLLKKQLEDSDELVNLDVYFTT